MTITLIILAIVFAFLSGISKAICDLSEDRKIKGNPDYWQKAYSWRNKWKLDKTGNLIKVNYKYVERFFGSSRWFVAFTDAWHLFGVLNRISFAVTYTCIGILTAQSDYYWIMLLCYPFSMTVFHIFYTSKILRK